MPARHTRMGGLPAMKRIALVFFTAIFLPSLVLGFLALRTAGEQRMLIERQAVELYQNDTDRLAADLNSAILERQRAFTAAVRELLTEDSATDVAARFGPLLGKNWQDLGVPFAVSADSRIAYPTEARRETGTRSGQFLRDNAAFLSNEVATELYPAADVAAPRPPLESDSSYRGRGISPARAAVEIRELTADMALSAPAQPAASAPQSRAKEGRAEFENQRMDKSGAKDLVERQVVPQKMTAAVEQPAASRLVPEFSDFQTATSKGTEGLLARFVRNEVELIFWTRPPGAGGTVFGIGIPAAQLAEMVSEIFPALAITADGTCLVILDERARPVARSVAGFESNWKSPFVATEIGEILPHWEAALYLLEPDRLVRSAELMTITITLLIALALAAILAGGWFVATDARRQLVIAQQKTDFVSNVSHELKTPLTSIRMFAELLQQGRIDEPAKRDKYLRIITLESERLTRLINNVLDFARSEKSRRTCHLTDIDLHPVIERLWEAQAEHLAGAGFAGVWEAADPPYPVRADADAISQVIVNLLANAEKYSGSSREVTLRTWTENGSLCVSVLDRGPGIPPGEEGKIFEAFYRCDDSLASGVQGSGLGLTLARRIAEEHGGTLTVRARHGGGSEFILQLPLRTQILT